MGVKLSSSQWELLIRLIRDAADEGIRVYEITPDELEAVMEERGVSVPCPVLAEALVMSRRVSWPKAK